MSASYRDATDGQEIQVMTPLGHSVVTIGEYDMSLQDFLDMFEYVMQNTDLIPNDPRLRLIEKVKKARQVAGYNQGKQRIKLS